MSHPCVVLRCLALCLALAPAATLAATEPPGGAPGESPPPALASPAESTPAAAAEPKPAEPAAAPFVDEAPAAAAVVAPAPGPATSQNPSPDVAAAHPPGLQDLGEELTITATRAPRRTRDVPQAITVVGQDRLADSITFNVKDVVAGTPGVLVETKNGGYDSRLIIRGAGLKANYGVREIMVLRDGVPLTDPDSLTRLDFVDMQDIERIEISKGPGSLYAPGSAGGAIQIVSRSVFDRRADDVRAAYGTYGAANLHLRASGSTGAAGSLALTASLRRQENGWRLWNQFESKQVSLKHGLPLGGGGALESEVAYTQSDIQLPGAMNQAGFEQFLQTGEQRETSEPWRHSGRYSKILFANLKLERDLGAVRVRPRAYFTQWTHLHPVTGGINDTRDWTRILGTDLEGQHRHDLGPAQGTLVLGVTGKYQWNHDVRKFQYRDVRVANGRIVGTLSDAEGAQMDQQRQWAVLYGAFAQESIQLGPVLLDAGLRFDRSQLHVEGNEITRFDYTSGAYVPGAGPTITDKTFDLPAPKVGLSVRLLGPLTAYASWAMAAQIPSESEITSNPGLEPARSQNLEGGLKLRSPAFSADVAVFRNRVTDEIVSYPVNGVTVFQNAGETRKVGIEASFAARLAWGLEVGAGYAWSDFTYVAYLERSGAVAADRSGNHLPYIPEHQWSAFASWKGPAGLRARVQTSAWGRYWLDAANSATYDGYTFLTSLGLAWSHAGHELLLDVENALDRRYAMQVTKDANGRVTYGAGTPRTVMLGYRYAFGGQP